jgi:hypothetical protein
VLEAWQPLTGIIEKRWQERFGKDVIDRLQELLQALVDNFDGFLPDYRPTLGYDLLSHGPDRPAGAGFALHPSARCRFSFRESCWRSPSNLSATQVCRLR